MPSFARWRARGSGVRVTGTLTARAAAVTSLVAVLSVLATALVAVPVAVRVANREVKESLSREATLVADLLATRTGDGDALVRRMRKRGFDIYLVVAGRASRGGLPDPVLRTLASGGSVEPRIARVAGRTRLISGKPVPGRPGNGVVLTASPVTGTAAAVWSRLWLALLAGLLTGLAAGPSLARRLVRPIRQAAHAASRLSAGDRSVRLATNGPAEAADLADAINNLAEALTTSEGRQRDFLLSVSHELRTPLTTIKGYAEALADGVIGPDGAQRAGQTVLSEAERLDRLIADLLVLARLEAADLPVEFLAVDLAQLVTAAGEAWGGRYAAAGVPLRVEVPPDPVQAVTDPGRVRQILDGLLENALRVVPPGAPVVLAAGLRRRDLATVEVRDGGPGLTDDDLAVAFQRGALYRRYRGIRKVGSGLGLAMAARLARRLAGEIEAGHAAEGGARFVVSLPVARPSADAAGSPRRRHGDP
ncbi:MAG: HAMP domain-containing histidine kinase [Dactylosporangium sp.]|nr:HAMP domain-containing histidine kinase [Dactylosporangium sp.]NNJ61552.1 HAMP domain-containing histidine kinase [Dactylosporangium sp.]